VLLSGGLDSSLVAAIAARKIGKEGTVWGKLHSFCVGLPGSPDLKAAREVASFLGTDHHEFTFTVQEGIDAISDVIYHIETYDVTTIRASTPMFLMSRKIKAMGVKMVLSGEGSDEVFGGYLYFHKAPNKVSLEEAFGRLRRCPSAAVLVALWTQHVCTLMAVQALRRTAC
jgi:asparagine synthase (glutamine-hydrolysing)